MCFKKENKSTNKIKKDKKRTLPKLATKSLPDAVKKNKTGEQTPSTSTTNTTSVDNIKYETDPLLKNSDRELNVTKSLTNIFKKYLSRNVVIKYTAKKRVRDKRIMKGTHFYECISAENF